MTADVPKDHPPTGRDRLLKATSIVGLMTLLSRLTGLARDIAFSSWFGSGLVMDAFAVAFKIPNLLRRFFAEGAFSQAFVPVISEYRTGRTLAETRELVDRVAGTLGLGLLVVTLVGVIAAPLMILAFAPGFSGEDGRFGLAVDMLATFPYICSSVERSPRHPEPYRRFAVAAFTPVLLNVVRSRSPAGSSRDWIGPDSAWRPACWRREWCNSAFSCRFCGGSACCRGHGGVSVTRVCAASSGSCCRRSLARRWRRSASCSIR
jgi:hypothetical protein